VRGANWVGVQAIDQIKTWGVKIETEDDAKMAIRLPQVGDSTVKNLIEILQMGTAAKAVTAEATMTAKDFAAQELTKLQGLGPKTAEKLQAAGASSFDDLRKEILHKSQVLATCKVAASAICHAPFIEETMQPIPVEGAKQLRLAIAEATKAVSDSIGGVAASTKQ
jgi:DNA polymerase/3'-5' exonuclease PolX